MPTASRTRVKRTWRARLAGEEFSRNGERSELSTRCHFPWVGFSEIEMNNQRFPRQEVFSCKRFAWIKFRFAASILTSAVSYRNARVAARGHEASVRDPGNYLRPSRFCAIASPRGVGSKTTERRPSCSSRNADSRTTRKCELAS